MRNDMTIGSLADQIGLKPETLRYYERLGLIAPSGRTESNYRVYDGKAKRRLQFIRRAQALGFSLSDIAGLLSLHERPEADMGEVKQLAERKIAEIEMKITDLERMKAGLSALSQRCPGHGSTAGCPILNALLTEEPE